MPFLEAGSITLEEALALGPGPGPGLTSYDDDEELGIEEEAETLTLSTSMSYFKIAIGLKNKYYEEINNEEKLRSVLQEFRHVVKMSPKVFTPMAITAEHCIDIVTGETYGQYVDVVSEISNRELVALIYLASKDEDRRTSEKKDSDFSLIDVIYNIARSGNLNRNGRDDGEPSRPTYSNAKVFYKLVFAWQNNLSCEKISNASVLRYFERLEHREERRELGSRVRGSNGGGGSGGGR